MKNYFNQLMTDGYDLLVKDNNRWPADLSDSQKVELLQQAINYFISTEEYEKCAILQKKINEMFDVKRKPRRRRPTTAGKRRSGLKKLKV